MQCPEIDLLIPRFQSFGDNFLDVGLDLFDAVVSVDDDDAVRFAGGDLFVLVVDAAVEVVGLALEKGLVGALPLDVTLVAGPGSLGGGLAGGTRGEGEAGGALGASARAL